MASMGVQPQSTPKTRARIENEIERNREDGNWSRCLDLAHQLHSDNPQLAQFIMGEAKLEKYLEATGSTGYQGSSATSGATAAKVHQAGPDAAGSASNSALLKDAKHHLFNCLTSGSDLAMDASLLLSKHYFVIHDYETALKYIKDSGIDIISKAEKQLSLRVMKLVAESFAIKGICLEKLKDKRKNKESTQEELEERISSLVKASDLGIRYLQNIEKQNGPYIVVQLGSILEQAIQRAPIAYIQSGKVHEAVQQYRNVLNAVETPSTMSCRQITSRQLAEVILRGISSSAWTSVDLNLSSSSGPWKPQKYIGQSLFVPKKREEEILLLLYISDLLASRNVVLDRSAEFSDARLQSLHNVMAVYDLLTIATIPHRYFITDTFERSMKFSFEIKHIWFQFALTLMESGKCPERSLSLFKEVAHIDPEDPLPNLMAAKLCLLEIHDPNEALNQCQEALKKCTTENGLLLPRLYLYIGVSHAILYEMESESGKKLKRRHLRESIKYLKRAMKADPSDHLPHFHLALHMAHQRAIPDAINYAKCALVLCPHHLPSIQLLIFCLTSQKQYHEALNLCEAGLEEYPDCLPLLYIKANLEQIALEDGKELALLTARHMLRCCRFQVAEEAENRPKRSTQNSTANYQIGVNYDTLSLKMEQTLSEVTSIDGDSGGAIGTIENGFASGPIDGTLSNISLWAFQLQIWILITELYLKLDQVSEAEACLHEGIGCIFGPLSHQLMYIRGVLCKAKGRLIEAKNHLLNCISINPRHVRALQQLGHIYYLLGNMTAADKHLRDSLSVDSTLHETWAIMALVLEALGDSERAFHCSQTSLQLEATAPILPFQIIARNVLE